MTTGLLGLDQKDRKRLTHFNMAAFLYSVVKYRSKRIAAGDEITATKLPLFVDFKVKSLVNNNYIAGSTPATSTICRRPISARVLGSNSLTKSQRIASENEGQCIASKDTRAQVIWL